MRFSILAGLLLASPIFAFTIPEGQAEGVYSVSYDEHGNETHTLVQPGDPNEVVPTQSLSNPNSAKFKFEKRDDFTYTCGGDALNHQDTDDANRALDNQCGAGTNVVGGGMDFYSIVGCTVSYYCNFAWTSSVCSYSRRQDISGGITQACGWYMSGWSNQNPNDSGSYGYEDFCKAPGNNFCGRGR